MVKTLVVLAAKMGNKYGGLKKAEEIGPNGETILDYSIYDAIHVGFDRVIFVIGKYFEEDFKRFISFKYEKSIKVEFAYQEEILGSANALLMAESLLDGPFGVINAFSFYQRESFQLLWNNLQSLKQNDCFFVCYRLSNVMAESGGVTRGICELDDQNKLLSVVDRYNIERVGAEPAYRNEFGKMVGLDENILVSMNMWGFNSNIFHMLHKDYSSFTETYGISPKSHYTVPIFVNRSLREGLNVRGVNTAARWMGLVSADDRSQAILRINEMIRKGVYPPRLFEITN